MIVPCHGTGPGSIPGGDKLLSTSKRHSDAPSKRHSHIALLILADLSTPAPSSRPSLLHRLFWLLSGIGVKVYSHKLALLGCNASQASSACVVHVAARRNAPKFEPTLWEQNCRALWPFETSVFAPQSTRGKRREGQPRRFPLWERSWVRFPQLPAPAAPASAQPHCAYERPCLSGSLV